MFKHSSLIERTNLSAYGFRSGLCGGPLDGLHTSILQNLAEGRAEQRVSVMDEVLRAAEEAIAAIGEVASNLLHPRLVRLSNDAGDPILDHYEGAGGDPPGRETARSVTT